MTEWGCAIQSLIILMIISIAILRCCIAATPLLSVETVCLLPRVYHVFAVEEAIPAFVRCGLIEFSVPSSAEHFAKSGLME